MNSETSSMSTPSDACEPSGTLVARNDQANSDAQSELTKVPSSPTDTPNSPHDGEEEALESHEVIELQKFSERKAWIEEKIKFLGNMPPIEVFAGLDAIRTSSDEVPGLPTRAELKKWISEHDLIEKETEIFDSGELKKLKKFTKAATQRNLSPEDTDLIELTLTTIYELDKLLHLLRDRSENLDLLGVRLAWEEQRVAAWADRHKIFSDLQSFLACHARWSPDAYDAIKNANEPSFQRGSSGSTATDASIHPSHEISRSARFKLAEQLSKDAAQFVGRVTSLRHGKIAAAGKALDKLIENSRHPVPEELLDEQDRLEEYGITHMEGIDKFVMNMVVQWRKADEIYVETMKDQATALALSEEIETAKLHHPNVRQSSAFLTRADALMKRLSRRGNPTSPTGGFPRPNHSLIPDQQSSTATLAQTLSSEISTAKTLTKKVEIMANEYRDACEAVRRVENIAQDASNLSATFTSIIDRLENGVTVSHGDGSPPDLSTQACLDPARHSVFLALLPSIIEESNTTSEKASLLLRNAHGACLILDRPGVDPSLKTNVTCEIQRLGALQERTRCLKTDVIDRVSRLRETRKMWSIMDERLKELEDVRRQLGDSMETHRWRKQSGGGETPLTPESPLALQFPTVTSSNLATQLDDIQEKLARDIESPLSLMSPSLEPFLNDWLNQSFKGLTVLLSTVRQMARLLEAIQKQAEVMGTVRSEFEDFQVRIEDVKLGFDSAMQRVLSAHASSEELANVEDRLNVATKDLRSLVRAFIDNLSQRIPFISPRDFHARSDGTFVKRRFSSQDLKLGVNLQQVPVEMPFDLSSLDDAVRGDANSYTMRLSGELEGLDQKANHFHLAWMAKELDPVLSSTIDGINLAIQKLASFKVALSATGERSGEPGTLQSLLCDLGEFAQAQRVKIGRSFSPLRERLSKMNSTPGVHDSAVHEVIYLARARAVDDAELKFSTWNADVETLRNQISEALRLETLRLEQERVVEERRVAEEKERLEEERRLQERQRLEAEKLAEEARLEEERRVQAEKERKEAEEAERLALERERFEAEEELRIEKERLAEERRVQEENDRLAMEEAERMKLEAKSLREEEESLAEEQRIRAEIERYEAEGHQSISGQERLEEASSIDETQNQVGNGCVLEEEKPKQGEEEEHGKLRAEDQAVNGCVDEACVSNSTVGSPVLGEDFVASPSLDTNEDLGEDVFGLRVSPSSSFRRHPKTQELVDLQARILVLRKRLRSMNINDVLRPQSSSSLLDLPSIDQAMELEAEFSALSQDVDCLPSSIDDLSVDLDLRSLRAEVMAAADMVSRVGDLSKFSNAICLCDEALSDLLEHIDSFPASPTHLSSSHVSQTNLPPEEQLSARLTFTKSLVDGMTLDFAPVSDDPRAVNESQRVIQTWSELEEMGYDRVHGRRSRPASVISSVHNSSGRSSRASSIGSLPAVRKQNTGYSSLSVRPSNRGRYLAPSNPNPNSRRATSGSVDAQSRSSSRISNRSVTGPLSSSIYSSTYASRQRTTSLSSNAPIQTPAVRASSKSQPRRTKRTGSPTFSDASSYSRSILTPSRSSTSTSTSTSTWARAPRQSFPTVPATPPRPKNDSLKRKKAYVANPQNKLDMAVGDVVNKLPGNINVEVVAETWKDQSGKYWIGDQDPKLCFCRILRSQTVMVRVGGGWSELSKFIKDHFADAFRLLPDSPPQLGAKEEKWISSATLLEAPEVADSPPLLPRTPEFKRTPIPSFSLLTPSGQAPRSLDSTPSTGSPLRSIQLIRRADPETLNRPTTPSKISNNPKSSFRTPTRQSVWRP